MGIIRLLFLKLTYFKFPVSIYIEGCGMVRGRAFHCKCKGISLAYRSAHEHSTLSCCLVQQLLLLVSVYKCEKLSIPKESSLGVAANTSIPSDMVGNHISYTVSLYSQGYTRPWISKTITKLLNTCLLPYNQQNLYT